MTKLAQWRNRHLPARSLTAGDSTACTASTVSSKPCTLEVQSFYRAVPAEAPAPLLAAPSPQPIPTARGRPAPSPTPTPTYAGGSMSSVEPSTAAGHSHRTDGVIRELDVYVCNNMLGAGTQVGDGAHRLCTHAVLQGPLLQPPSSPPPASSLPCPLCQLALVPCLLPL